MSFLWNCHNCECAALIYWFIHSIDIRASFDLSSYRNRSHQMLVGGNAATRQRNDDWFLLIDISVESVWKKMAAIKQCKHWWILTVCVSNITALELLELNWIISDFINNLNQEACECNKMEWLDPSENYYMQKICYCFNNCNYFQIIASFRRHKWRWNQGAKRRCFIHSQPSQL